MPIYAYRCTSCGHAQDVLQRMSDAVLTLCPACGASSYAKQLTAAGFQLKGSGWYVTDFRGGNTASAKAADGAEPTASSDKAADKAADKSADKTAGKSTDPSASVAKPADKSASAPTPAPSAPATPASGG